MNNIYLIGFMGAGKTTVGRSLAYMTGRRYIDTDEELVRREGRPVPEIFASAGETYFRERETALLSELSEESELIISCGGGAAANPANIPVLKRGGSVVYLRTSAETIFERVGESRDRPLLEGRRSVSGIAELLSVRIPLYEKAADAAVDTDGVEPSEIAAEILRVI